MHASKGLLLMTPLAKADELARSCRASEPEPLRAQSCNSYPTATPSEWFSLNHLSAASGVATPRWSLATYCPSGHQIAGGSGWQIVPQVAADSALTTGPALRRGSTLCCARRILL